MKLKRLLVVVLAVTLSLGSFYALDPKQELYQIGLVMAVTQKSPEEIYQLVKTHPYEYPEESIRYAIFDRGYMLDYLDKFKADGLVAQDYYPAGVSTPQTSTPAPQEPAHSHTYKEEVTKQSTCTEEGTLTKTCDCGSVVNEKLPLAEHTYFENVTKEVTCTEDGEVSYLCSVCDDTYTETKAATGHTTGKMETIKEATCLEDGEKGIKCSTCGEFIDTTIVPATGHTEGEWEVVAKPGLVTNGEQVKKCVDCEEVLVTEVVPYNQTALVGVIVAVAALLGVAGVAIYKKTHKVKRM